MATQPIRIVGPGEGGTPVRLMDAGGGVIGVDPESNSHLRVGQATAHRTFLTGGQATGSGVLRLAYFTAYKAETVSRVRVISSATAAAATPTLVRVGLYLIAANGDGTLVASTANDTSLFAAASTAYTPALTASYATVLGQRYAAAVLVVTSVTAPTILGVTGPGADSTEAAQEPRLSGLIGSQTDLPASFLGTAVGVGPTRPYAVLLP